MCGLEANRALGEYYVERLHCSIMCSCENYSFSSFQSVFLYNKHLKGRPFSGFPQQFIKQLSCHLPQRQRCEGGEGTSRQRTRFPRDPRTPPRRSRPGGPTVARNHPTRSSGTSLLLPRPHSTAHWRPRIQGTLCNHFFHTLHCTLGDLEYKEHCVITSSTHTLLHTGNLEYKEHCVITSSTHTPLHTGDLEYKEHCVITSSTHSHCTLET